MNHATALLLVLPTACSDDKAADSASSALDSSIDDTSDTALDDDTTPAPPCSDGGWGFIDEATAADVVHVRADGSDEGDGSQEAPVATVDRALALWRASGGAAIAIGSGTFDASLELTGELLSGSDDNLVIRGCGPEDTILEGSEDDAPVVRAVGVTGLQIVGLSLTGGYRGFVAWTGTSASLEDVAFDGNKRVGAVFDGAETTGSLTRVTVADPVSVATDSGETMAYGLSIQGATVTMSEVTVSRAARVGILVDAYPASVTLDEVTVEDTLTDDDSWGRGIQIQDFASASVTGGRLMGNSDAGIFALRSAVLDIDHVVIDGVRAGSMADSEATPGDGIVIAQADDTVYESPIFLVTLTGNQILEADRAGVVIDGSAFTVNASDNTIGTVAYDPSGTGQILTQGGPTMTGDAGFDLEAAEEPRLEYISDLMLPDDLNE